MQGRGDARSNGLIANEAAILRRLHAAPLETPFKQFLPALEAAFSLNDGPDMPPRQANVLKMDAEIRSPDELYTLFEIKSQYPDGLDARHVAWIWRRLLSVIGFAHAQGVVHGAVLPMHVLIEPRDHKLLLIGWCAGTDSAATDTSPRPIITDGHAAWYRRESALTRPPRPALDVSFAARCMIELLGGDPLRDEIPIGVDPALRRYFQRCLGTGTRGDAWKLLDDFDKLIDALWGPRQFVELPIAPKTRG